jgi:hypothetical protein
MVIFAHGSPGFEPGWLGNGTSWGKVDLDEVVHGFFIVSAPAG